MSAGAIVSGVTLAIARSSASPAIARRCASPTTALAQSPFLAAACASNSSSIRACNKAGAVVPAFNVGGLHYSPGRTKLNEYVYLDDADRVAARALLARGVALEARDVPASRSQSLVALEPALAP